jgi:hypothetical protein
VGNFCTFICKVEVAAVRAAIFLASGGVGAVNVLKTFVLSGGVGESRRADTVIPRFLLTRRCVPIDFTRTFSQGWCG